MDTLFTLNLGEFGAEGFTFRDRLDGSRHGSGLVEPHINSEIVNPNGEPLRRDDSGADFRDLCNNPLPGLNGMRW